ncbi:MAG: MATE family efflux transporter [Mycetocola reblochoni]|uniref:DNA-damage-inducible protein F n=2 Tax=Mycetocola reblochoni TaxID=331618 RepID=A0A1R4KDG0_9MICO|nr:MATE family efflux transporter [Mycetocola reblochoni]RLP71247.1 MATE family efflux transporter [Mycetocola reblochoni]SJN42194.1 DNA-damage-inducible protein F [Mycetocola reblochoni REB411]
MRAIDRSILRLAVPALGALIAEPLFLLTDSALIGHLGTVPLAGLGIAAAVLQTIIGLLVFLAYATTPAVARRLGAGDRRGAVAAGVDAVWLSVGIGVVVATAGAAATPALVGLFGASEAVSEQAAIYLSVSMAGVPAMLIVFAATGLLRGLQDTTTPLVVAVVGFAANAALNVALVYGAQLGIAGSALGTVIAQWGMVAAYLVVIRRHVRRTGAGLRPAFAGIRESASAGGWLLLRTASLRAAMLLAVGVASGVGTDTLAGYQLVITIFSTTAFALDALAIAAQALVGHGLGAGDTAEVSLVLRRCLLWGVGFGVVVGAVVVACSGVIGLALSGDPALAELIRPSLIALGVASPLAGFVFVLDGVLIGAGDARYLALTGVVNLAVSVPLFLLAPALPGSGATTLLWLTIAVTGGYMLARAVTLGLRARSDAWRRLGV